MDILLLCALPMSAVFPHSTCSVLQSSVIPFFSALRLISTSVSSSYIFSSAFYFTFFLVGEEKVYFCIIIFLGFILFFFFVRGGL